MHIFSRDESWERIAVQLVWGWNNGTNLDLGIDKVGRGYIVCTVVHKGVTRDGHRPSCTEKYRDI